MGVVCALQLAHFSSGDILNNSDVERPSMPHCRVSLSTRASHRSWCVFTMCLRTKSTVRSAEALLRKEKSMVTIKVKDGTPQGAETLCVTCRWAHIVKGFRESEKEIFCRYLADDRPVRYGADRLDPLDQKGGPHHRLRHGQAVLGDRRG